MALEAKAASGASIRRDRVTAAQMEALETHSRPGGLGPGGGVAGGPGNLRRALGAVARHEGENRPGLPLLPGTGALPGAPAAGRVGFPEID